MESINVVTDDYNDVLGVPSEDEIYGPIFEKEKQLLSEDVPLDVTPYAETSFVTESENENFHITDPVIRDPPTRIQRNHPTKNIIGEINDGRKTREKTRLNYRDMVRNVCYTSSIEP